ncbi:MAG: DNA mismatch repair protein MutS [Odoribacteraceae bacterium]|jgi:dsDNA-specific endonuclease/ATPase MutS2|nr:DNA mismatch repair protein MutS [Odoribacteraceae bacterium]
MTLKEAIEEIDGLRYAVDRLKIQSGAGRRLLLDSPYLTTGEEIHAELDRVEALIPLAPWPEVTSPTSRVKDIRGTIHRLATGATLDDIELFEIKTFALLAGEIAVAARAAGVTVVQLPLLEEVVEILDPEGNRLPRFYLHDNYSPELARLRALLKTLSPEEASSLFAEREAEEERVRASLAERLRAHHRALAEALVAVARLDVLLAKARLARETGECRPLVANTVTRYEGLFHPRVREALHARGREFQPVDIAFDRGPCLITGANMGGKTVLLKSLAVAQALFQFGFHVPAARAEIVPVEGLLLSLYDGQDEARGISSFASEMLQLDRVVREIKGGKEALVLMDEPARGTNPTEGVAIVNAITDLFACYRTRSLITTHYSGVRVPCRKLRIKGLDGQTGNFAPRDLSERMDYSLVEEERERVPREATRVAEMLGVDAEIIEKIKQYVSHE